MLNGDAKQWQRTVTYWKRRHRSGIARNSCKNPVNYGLNQEFVRVYMLTRLGLGEGRIVFEEKSRRDLVSEFSRFVQRERADQGTLEW